MTSEIRDPVFPGQFTEVNMEEARTEVTSDKYTDDENSDAFSEFQGAILWPRRSLLYRISFLALLPLFGIFLMGFISPFWMKEHDVVKYRGHYNEKKTVDVSIGLWRVCEGTDYSDITDCTVIPDGSPYFVICQSMLCLSLIFTVFSLVFGLYENCATRYDMEDGNEVRTKRPEMNAVMAGLFGLTGVCMYGTKIIEAARRDEGAVHWAFPVTAASVTGVIVCGILMAIANPIHTATPSYPGQIMSLSRQASLRIREPSVQDRLVITSESVAPASSSQAAGTMYGVAGANCDDKDVSFLTRSESCLSSHMSSPDIYTATVMDPGLSHVYRSTHVVEPHDIHARAYDQARRQMFKQQLQNKAAQRRSWHFDDRNGAYIVTDLINNRPGVPLPAYARPQKEHEEERPPIPPRRDKLISPPASKRLPGSEIKPPDQNNASDLMMLEDPIVTAPVKIHQNISAVRPDESSLVKRNTNPFIDDTIVNTSQMLSDLQRSTLSNSSWETQSWPDPPSESEILGQTAPAVPTNSSTTSDKSASNVYASQLKSVPESLQYQPQNYNGHPRKAEQSDESKFPYNTLKSNETQNKSSKSNHTDRSHRHKKSVGGKITPPALEAQVPVKKEYDNPLFKAQAPDGDRPMTLGENFSLQICESTSFVHPSPEQPPPSSFYAAIGNTKSDPSSPRRHSGHFTYTPILEDSENVDNPIAHVTYDQRRNTAAPPSYSRYNNRRPEDTLNKHSSPKDKPRSNSKQLQQQNGIVKSRPRQVKREHQQRRNGHPEPGKPQQYQPVSPHTGRYGSSPDLVSKSPRVGRRRPDSVGPENDSVYAKSDHIRNFNKFVQEHKSGTYGYDTNRQSQSPYYNIQPGQYRHWGDSDL